MSSWTTPKDIKDRWLLHEAIPTDTQLQLFIDDVERQIRNHYKQIQERIDDGLIELDYIKQVVANIIIEFLQTKGQPFTYESQSYSGAGSQSVGYLSSKARFSLSLTADDYALLAPSKSSGVISLSSAPDMRSERHYGKIIRYTKAGIPIYYEGL